MLGMQSATWADSLTLAQVPAGNGGREPAPNIIVSVDDSGSMGSDGIADLKAALNDAFSSTKIPDDSIRLGFQAMWRCRGLASSPYKNYGTTCPDTRIRKFSGTHRSNFNTWVNSLKPANTTPSHAMVYIAGQYMKTTGKWSPYASDPGTTETPLLACRKSFHIFMTDGEWNSEDEKVGGVEIQGKAGNADGETRVLPDGVRYDPYDTHTDSQNATLAHTKIFRDAFGSSTTNTLADFAFDQWATDAQPDIADEVRPIIRQAGSADFGKDGTPYVIPEYWNPKNNPATWQHLVTYTIGFNSAADLPTTRSNQTVTINGKSTNIKRPAWGGSSWEGDFAALIRGDFDGTRAIMWGNPLVDSDTSKRQELWHMAINGRGRFVPATSATELSNAFAEIVNQIIVDSSTPLTTIAANTQTVTSGTRVYTAGYDAAKWSGYLQSKTLSASYTLSTTALWDAATVLDAATPANRAILTHDGTSGVSFVWDSLSSSQKDALKGSDSTTVGQNRMAYLRGDRGNEQSAGGAFRNRATRLGDIVNSNIWVLGKPDLGYTSNGYSTFRSDNASRTTMIYVGANDGMLHGFSASDGSEKLAYVPRGVFANLKSYTEPAYPHRYFVDGHPFTGDMHDGTNWKTLLVGTLAGGGKGYFVLDVTNPANWTATNASSAVVMDNTDGSDADIGHIYSEPTLDTSNSARVVQITKLNNNRWALLMGNGVNSSSEKAVLLIQYLDGSKELVKIPLDSTGGNGNGLSHPQVVDINGDGKADVAYAGDLQGNLWKIDLSSATAANWGSYFKSGSTPVPLYIAKDSSGARQPITTAPQWATHPIKGLMIAFGTGREMTASDRTTISEQTLYSVWDDAEFKPKSSPMMVGGTAITTSRTDLVAQTQTSSVTINGQNYFKTSSNAIDYTGSTPKRGWYMRWPNEGERSVNNGGMLSNQLLFMRSRLPASGSQTSSTEESCEPNAKAAAEFLTVLDIISGKASSKPVFDTDGGGFTGTEEAGVSRWETGKEDRLLLQTGRPGETVSIGNGPAGQGPTCTGTNCRLISSNLRLNRSGWRQLQ